MKTALIIHRQQGSTLAETLYVMPLFLILVFGTMEMAFAYKTKATLNLATQEAVRAGTLNNAHLSSIQNALSAGMAPLYASRNSCPGNSKSILGPGLGCAKLIQTAIGQQAVTIVSPSKEIFDAFKKNLKIKAPGETEAQAKWVIPNDNLKWRSADTKSVIIGGESLSINIQDANLLKIKTLWCHKVTVPGLDRLYYNTILRFNGSPEQQFCNRLTNNTSGASVTNAVYGTERGVYLAITAHAIARMQSPVEFADGNLLNNETLKKRLHPETSTEPEPEINPNPVIPPKKQDPTDPLPRICTPGDPDCEHICDDTVEVCICPVEGIG